VLLEAGGIPFPRVRENRFWSPLNRADLSIGQSDFNITENSCDVKCFFLQRGAANPGRSRVLRGSPAQRQAGRS
jgi:hypothetical protein